jgi:hypothetical protein
MLRIPFLISTHTINAIKLVTNLQQNWAGHFDVSQPHIFVSGSQPNYKVAECKTLTKCMAWRPFISPPVSSRQIRQICVVWISKTILETWIQEMGKRGREGGNLLLFSVFGTRTVVFQIAIPWNLLKASSSSYHVSYSVQSILLCQE